MNRIRARYVRQFANVAIGVGTAGCNGGARPLTAETAGAKISFRRRNNLLTAKFICWLTVKVI